MVTGAAEDWRAMHKQKAWHPMRIGAKTLRKNDVCLIWRLVAMLEIWQCEIGHFAVSSRESPQHRMARRAGWVFPESSRHGRIILTGSTPGLKLRIQDRGIGD